MKELNLGDYLRRFVQSQNERSEIINKLLALDEANKSSALLKPNIDKMR